MTRTVTTTAMITSMVTMASVCVMPFLCFIFFPFFSVLYPRNSAGFSLVAASICFVKKTRHILKYGFVFLPCICLAGTAR